tara:strand:- start:111 stop:851 length:741 start_codon:yes stop_codon:yes gene_type:complete
MKKIIVITGLLIVMVIYIGNTLISPSDNELPPCEGDQMTWTACSITLDSGDKYVGEWKEGRRTGQGTYTWMSGTKYIGGFHNSQRHGKGTNFFSDGRVDDIWFYYNQPVKGSIPYNVRSFKLEFNELTASEILLMNRHHQLTIEKLPVIMQSWDAPNNEARCVDFFIEDVSDSNTNWELRELHDDYCGGDPASGPRISSVSIYEDEDEEGTNLIFTKWCTVINDSGEKDFLPLNISLSSNPSGECP